MDKHGVSKQYSLDRQADGGVLACSFVCLPTISMMSVTAVSSTAWFLSLSNAGTLLWNSSINSGTFRMMRTAHSAPFLRMYAFWCRKNFSTSFAKSRAMSALQMLPNDANARPTM
jgi:hypothetical protein